VAYAVQSDISDRYGTEFLLDIADRDGDGAVTGDDATAITAALDDGAALIDSYVSLKYDDPANLDPEPPVFKRWNVDVACHLLASENRGSYTKIIEDRYDRAVEEMQAVALGNMGLGVADPPATTGATTVLKSNTINRGVNDTEGLI
jgi:phage gp36-like protein